ncbi:MAG: hypothetical protein DI569_02395 [Sphingopyxis macrogoltabida]|uniref:LSU ribosomal protein L21p n=1 Tax=Sphingopyxis macrogoltabida TaxID=33050 RepID=A0A2W5L501_SPHMC|nr:MAG: hypothetical protein DI569_02395 [Sphingopyxis macrogoltabida]
MLWLQENWIIAVVGLVVAVILLWWLFGRKKPEEIETPLAPPAEPKKPLEAVKPDIVAAEPARFKPKEPAPAAVVTPSPAPPPAPTAIPEEPTVPADPAPATPAPSVPAPKAEAKPEPVAAVVPEEPAVPPPAPAPQAASDNLQLLKGVGPKMVALLNGLGITSFRQIADWSDADVAAIDAQLGAFKGRIGRDAIVDQAGYLARGDKAGFEAKYGALGGEL